LAQAERRVAEIGELFTLLYYEGELFFFRFKDEIRPRVKKTLATLKNRWKMRLLMLTGDHYESAKTIAAEAGIEEFFADLRPEEKLVHIDRLAKKENLAMVGDGINDAPSLARATVGISMGKRGSATAIDASDIVLMHDNIEHLEWLIRKAHKTKSIVRQNLLFALGAILLATIPALFGGIPLWTAVLLHEGGTVLVGLNALRLLGRR
jgi:P-type E1-E2 ATPase